MTKDEIYLEGACGHEFAWDTAEAGIPPWEAVCSEHGLTALWVQRSQPRSAEPLPRGKLTTMGAGIP